MSKIVCKWKKDDKYMVNPDGQVFQCCYLKMHDHKRKDKTWGKDQNHSVAQEYSKNYPKYNLTNASLSTIINSSWFTKTLPESWSDPETAPYACQHNCKVNE
jgi:hypothetical protein